MEGESEDRSRGEEGRTMKMNSKLFSVVTAAVLGTTVMAKAAQLVTFTPFPTSSTLPEFALTPTQFVSSIGTLSGNSSDPFNPVNVGGLLIQTPLTIPGVIAGKQINISTGSTQFYDTSLVLSTSVTANAQSFVVPGFGTEDVQPTSSGSFAFYASSSPATAGTLLLSGTFTTGAIGGADGGSTASFQSNDVTYTGGAIFAELPPGVTTGNLSISMTDLSVPVSLAGTPGSLQMVPFTANATGLYSTPVIPEPASAAAFGLPGLLLLARRRRA